MSRLKMTSSVTARHTTALADTWVKVSTTGGPHARNLRSLLLQPAAAAAVSSAVDAAEFGCHYRVPAILNTPPDKSTRHSAWLLCSSPRLRGFLRSGKYVRVATRLSITTMRAVRRMQRTTRS